VSLILSQVKIYSGFISDFIILDDGIPFVPYLRIQIGKARKGLLPCFFFRDSQDWPMNPNRGKKGSCFLQGKNPQGKNPQGKNPQGKNPQSKNPQGKNPQGKNPQVRTHRVRTHRVRTHRVRTHRVRTHRVRTHRVRTP
jgi:hypothetical protein